MITIRDFIELTNASGKKLSKILVNAYAISVLEQPENTENVGCILLVNDQLLPVKESYTDVMQKMNKILGG